MFHWVVPWTLDDSIDFLFLALATVVVTAVPMVYGARANLRDPLARAVLAGTSATALAFIATAGFTMAFHAGWNPDDMTEHWVARLLYLAVAFGKATLLIGILRVLKVSRNRKGSE